MTARILVGSPSKVTVFKGENQVGGGGKKGSFDLRGQDVFNRWVKTLMRVWIFGMIVAISVS